MLNTRAVSDLLGVILLLGIVLLMVGIITASLLGQGPPELIPATHLLIDNRSTTVFLYHNGGDPLATPSFVIRVGNQTTYQEYPGSAFTGDPDWHIGETISRDVGFVPTYAAVWYRSESVARQLARRDFTDTILEPTPTVTPTPTPTPGGNHQILLNSDREGYVRAGGYFQFTIRAGSSASTIDLDDPDQTVTLTPGDIVRLTVLEDGPGEIDAQPASISRFLFESVRVTRNGEDFPQTRLATLWISKYDSLTSTLTYYLPPWDGVAGNKKDRLQTYFVVNGTVVFGWNDYPREAITIYGLKPGAAQAMRLSPTHEAYYDGWAGGYTLG